MRQETEMAAEKPIDAVELAVFHSRMHSLAKEMGAALRRTALSPNIKERRDYSCAVFDRRGRVIAMGDHMPVHLGSMPMSVRAAINTLTLGPGDVAMLNDPFAGGTHLPDITLVVPVYLDAHLLGYVANRAHHADVGGRFAGSMGPAESIYQEGIRIPPTRVVVGGVVQEEVLGLILANVRTPEERRGDLEAQVGACRVGERRMVEFAAGYGLEGLERRTDALLEYSERMMREAIGAMPAGRYEAEDFLDDDGVSEEPVRIAVAVTIEPEERRLAIDFSGSSRQVAGSINAVYAITLSACFYVMRCLLGEDAPATEGILRPLTMTAPEGSVVHARPPAAVAGGNVETSQRIVDTLMRAFAQALPQRVPAASAGTMSNLTIGGVDPRSEQAFTYYETTAGGMGARPGLAGLSAVQTHMTNSLNTPVEALEYAYPFRVRRYAVRRGSGGAGAARGGDGLVREIELLADAQVTLLADRRRFAPWGLAGGGPGACGAASLVSAATGATTVLRGKTSVSATKGDMVRLETPGGGGWGER